MEGRPLAAQRRVGVGLAPCPPPCRRRAAPRARRGCGSCSARPRSTSPRSCCRRCPPIMAASIEAGSGPMRVRVGREQAVQVRPHDAGLRPDPGPVVEHAGAAEERAELHQDVVAHRLAGERRARGAEGQVAAGGGAPRRGSRAPRPCRGADDRLGDEAVDRGVGGAAQAVDRAARARGPGTGSARGRRRLRDRQVAWCLLLGGLGHRHPEAVAGAAGVQGDRRPSSAWSGGRASCPARRSRGRGRPSRACRARREGGPRRRGSAGPRASGRGRGSGPGRRPGGAPAARPRPRPRSAPHDLHRQRLVLGRDRRLGRQGLAGRGRGRRLAAAAVRRARPGDEQAGEPREETPTGDEPEDGGGSLASEHGAGPRDEGRALSYNGGRAAAHATHRATAPVEAPARRGASSRPAGSEAKMRGWATTRRGCAA